MTAGDPVAMDAAARQVSSSAEILRGLKDRVCATVTHVGAAYSHSPAARALIEVGNAYATDLDRMLAVLDDMHQRLDGTRHATRASAQSNQHEARP